MNKAQQTLIRQRYENAVHEYCIAFCTKQGYAYDPDEWVGEDIGGVVMIGDMYIDFSNIRYDIDHDVEPGKFVQWYDYALEIAMLDNGRGDMRQVNYKHWLMGARPYSEEDLEEIREAKKRVEESEQALMEIIKRQGGKE